MKYLPLICFPVSVTTATKVILTACKSNKIIFVMVSYILMVFFGHVVSFA